jgi:hypothetical protein
LTERRAIAGALIEAVTVASAGTGGPKFDPSRVSIEWKV